MQYQDIVKGLTKLSVTAGDEIELYNLSPLHSIDIISGPNGLLNIGLLPRSGLTLAADSVLSVQTKFPVTVAYRIREADQIVGQSLRGKSFYLDAGHGGSDPGAVNENLGLEEKIAALDICLLLGESLESKGAIVYYSRTSDTYPNLSIRTSEANERGVDAFISVHLNSSDNKSAAGVETLVYSLNGGTANKLANVVQEKLVAATNFKNRGVRARSDLHVLRATKMPAILCEVGFISNDQEAKLLFNKPFQRSIAIAISQGVEQVFGS